MKQEQYEAAVPRLAQLVAGAVSALLAPPTILLGLAFAWFVAERSTARPGHVDAVLVAIAAGALLLGGTLATAAIRLLSGKQRARSGGLLSPSALRLAALLTAATGLTFLALLDWHSLHAGECFLVAAACWHVAKKRETDLLRDATPPAP